MNEKTLYVDIDSTIWPAEQEYDKAAQELYGKPFRSHWYDIEELIEEFGSNYQDLFRYALQPELVHERKLYPGVKKALEVVYDHGVDIHFLTHNFEPEIFETPIREWLMNIMTMPFELSIHTEDRNKIETMLEDESAWGIVEDKPSTLEYAEEMGFVTFAKQQPWNSLTLQENVGIIGFDQWSEFVVYFKQAMWLDSYLGKALVG